MLFSKYHALGNDYLVLDPKNIDLARSGEHLLHHSDDSLIANGKGTTRI